MLAYIKESEDCLERGYTLAESHAGLENARRIICLSVEITAITQIIDPFKSCLPDEVCAEHKGQASLSCLTLLLKLFRRTITQGRMQSFLVVIALDELFDAAPQMLQVLVLVGVDLFPLQRLDEALATSVVVRVGWPAPSTLVSTNYCFHSK
jgi:hypothetical protein